MYHCTYGREASVPYNFYDLEIRTSDGQSEMMQNGLFSQIKGKINTKYYIRWKLKSESKWKEIVEEIPEIDASNIKQINMVNNGSEIYINNILENKDCVYFLSRFDSVGTQKFASFASYFSNFSNTAFFSRPSIENNKQFVKLYGTSDNRLIIWPPRISDNPYWTDYKPCLKPFDWSTGSTTQKYAYFNLFQMSKKDYDVFRVLLLNDKNSEGPLYVGESIQFDYKEDVHCAHVLTYYRYKGIMMKDLLEYDAKVHFKIRYKGAPLDTSKINIRVFSAQFKDIPRAFPPYQFSLDSGVYFFKDYIASQYNGTNAPCGKYQSEYWYRPYIDYTNKITGKRETYVGDYVKYEYQSYFQIIDIQ